MTDRYRTSLADVECRAWTDDGWTVEPLLDARTGLYARLTGADALRAVAALGARLPTRAEVYELHELAAQGLAVEVTPVILPTPAMVRASGLSSAQRLRDREMASRAWAELHDAEVRRQLAALGHDGRMRVSGAGKHPIGGAPPGRMYLCGWPMGGRMIQTGESADMRPPPDGPHGDWQHDYSITTIARKI